MTWFQHLELQKFLLFTLVLTRTSGLVMTAPIFGTSEIPMQIRGFLAFTLAVLMVPSQWHVPVAYPGCLANYLVFLGGELLIGVALGFGVSILFAGVDLAGNVIGQASGLMMAEIFDPAQGDNVPLFSRLLTLVTLAIFVCIGGHRMVMAALLDTFQALPPGGGVLPESLPTMFVALVTQSFALGIRAAAPVLAALLLANLVLGLIGRTVPQLNILALGLGLNALLTLGIMSLSLGAAAWVFQDHVEPTLELVLEGILGR